MGHLLKQGLGLVAINTVFLCAVFCVLWPVALVVLHLGWGFPMKWGLLIIPAGFILFVSLFISELASQRR